MTSGSAGRLWRAAVLVVVVIGAGLLVTDIAVRPSKRNIELLTGVIFLGFALVADPLKAILFTLIVVPYPAYTSVGSTSMLLIVGVFGLLMVKGKQLRLPSPFVRRDLDRLVLGWGIMVLLSFYKQEPSEYSVAAITLFGFVSSLMLYYMLISVIRTEEQLWRSIKVVQYVLLSLVILGLAQFLYPDRQILPAFFAFSRKVAGTEEILRGQVRVMATFEGVELFAEYLSLCAVLHYLLFRRSRGLSERTYWLISSLLLLACLFATATRGAFIVLLVGFAYMSVIGGAVIPRFQMAKLFFVAIALFYLSLSFIEPLVTHMLDRVMQIGAADSSVRSRSVVLGQAIYAIGDSPFLGHGLEIPYGTFRGQVTRNIHNLYVTLAYTIGIPGLIAFLWYLIALARSSWRNFRDPRIPLSLRELSLGLHVMLVMFMVDEIKIEYTRQPMYMHMTWTIFAWNVILWRICQGYRTGEWGGEGKAR